jgi:hypothetical protein
MTRLRKQRRFIRPSPLTTRSEIAATKRYTSSTLATAGVSRRRLPLDYLDSDDEYDKDASESDEDVGRSNIVSFELTMKI